MPTITPFLWFDDDLEQAIEFYGSVFGDAKVVGEQRLPDGALLGATLRRWLGQTHPGPQRRPRSPAHRRLLARSSRVKGQEEVDHYWDALLAGGGHETACGWLKDRFGRSPGRSSPTSSMTCAGNPTPRRRSRACRRC